MAEIVFRREDFYTIHNVSKAIVGLDKTAEDYEFRVQALIKRLIHHEKASVYGRVVVYGKDDPDHTINIFAKTQLETHTKMAMLPDEEIISWDIGPHKF